MVEPIDQNTHKTAVDINQRENNQADQRLIIYLKISIAIGLILLVTGIYLHMFSEYMESLGVTGIIISAVFIAFGLVFSLPTKIYLTFLLVKREQELKDKQGKSNE